MHPNSENNIKMHPNSENNIEIHPNSENNIEIHHVLRFLSVTSVFFFYI